MDDFPSLLASLSSAPPPAGQTPIKVPDSLIQHVDTHGLSRQDIVSLVSAVGQARNMDLARRACRLLVPRERVGKEEVEEVLAVFARCEVREQLVRWLVTCKEEFMMDDAINRLRQGYAVLFHFLDFETTKKDLCHLLYFITTRSEVTPFRCRVVSAALKRDPDHTELLMLGELFASYAPNWVVFPSREHGVAGLSGLSAQARATMRARFFSGEKGLQGEAMQWKRAVDALAQQLPALDRDVEKHELLARNLQLRSQRGKEVHLPMTHVIAANASEVGHSKRHKPHIEEIETPNELIASLIQYRGVDVDPKQVTHDYLHQHLSTFFPTEYFASNAMSPPPMQRANEDWWFAFQHWVELAQCFPKPLLGEYLEHVTTWDGIRFIDATLALTAWIPPVRIEILEERVLTPFAALIARPPTLDFRYRACDALASLLERWATTTSWPDHDDAGLHDAMNRLKAWLDETILFVLIDACDHPLAQALALAWIKRLCAMVKRLTTGLRDTLPGADVVRRLFLCSNAFCGAELAHVLIDAMQVASYSQQHLRVDRHVVDKFKTVIDDICKAWLLNKPFLDTEFSRVLRAWPALQRALGEEEVSEPNGLGLMSCPAFMGLYRRFATERPDMVGGGDDTKRSLSAFVKWLGDDGGVPDVTEFVHVCKADRPVVRDELGV